MEVSNLAKAQREVPYASPSNICLGHTKYVGGTANDKVIEYHHHQGLGESPILVKSSILGTSQIQP